MPELVASKKKAVLDEPTGFMDSWAEIEWLERFRALVPERTAIIITRRFHDGRAGGFHPCHAGRPHR